MPFSKESDINHNRDKKTKIVFNLIRYILDSHVGYLLRKSISYSPVSSDLDLSIPLKQLSEIYYNENLDTIDVQHLLSCLIYGSSIEVLGYDGANIKVSQSNPVNWVLKKDINDELVLAIKKSVIPAGSYYEESFLPKSMTVFTVYDADSIRIWQQDLKNESKFNLVQDDIHLWQDIPIIEYKASDDGSSFISDEIISIVDGINKVSSAEIDSINYHICSLLVIEGGFSIESLLAPNKDGKRPIDMIRETGYLGLDSGQKANFLTKGSITDQIDHALTYLKKAAIITGKSVDVEEIVGATGSTSGISIRLKFRNMENQSGTFTKYFSKGLRERIELFNFLWSAKGLPVLENYNIDFSLDNPVNENEIWQAVGIQNLLSGVDLLRLVPSVENPAEAWENKQKELKELQPTVPPALQNLNSPQQEQQANIAVNQTSNMMETLQPKVSIPPEKIQSLVNKYLK